MAASAGVAQSLLRHRDRRGYGSKTGKSTDGAGGTRPKSERYIAVPVEFAWNPGNARPAGTNGSADQAASNARRDQADSRQGEPCSASRGDLRRSTLERRRDPGSTRPNGGRHRQRSSVIASQLPARVSASVDQQVVLLAVAAGTAGVRECKRDSGGIVGRERRTRRAQTPYDRAHPGESVLYRGDGAGA